MSLAQTTFPISIKHDASETTISSQPKRIIALHPTSLEILLALGVQPVGIGGYGLMGAQPVGQAASTVPNFDDLLPIKPQHVGIENPSLEAMLALKPDLILSITFAAQNVYPQFSKIAPTLVYNYSGERSWEKGFFDVAKLLGREERARKVVSHLEAQARTNRSRLAPAIASGSKLAVFALRGSQLLSTGLGFAP